MPLAVLGPVAVQGPSGAVPVIGRKTREVLVLLALAAPRPMTAPALVERLWDEPPPSAIKTVQAHVSRVRTALAAADGAAGQLMGGPSGYRIVADPARLDVLAVEDLRCRARVATPQATTRCAAWLAAARKAWRGEPELPSTRAGDAERAPGRGAPAAGGGPLAAEIAAGRAAAAVGELEAMTALHPLRERLWELRMTALYRSGRQADAVAAFQPRAQASALTRWDGARPAGCARWPRAFCGTRCRRPRRQAARTRSAVPFDGPHYADAGGVHRRLGRLRHGRRRRAAAQPDVRALDAHLEEPHLAAAIERLAAGRR
jgi:hypothetical protein